MQPAFLRRLDSSVKLCAEPAEGEASRAPMLLCHTLFLLPFSKYLFFRIRENFVNRPKNLYVKKTLIANPYAKKGPTPKLPPSQYAPGFIPPPSTPIANPYAKKGPTPKLPPSQYAPAFIPPPSDVKSPVPPNEVSLISFKQIFYMKPS
jgi:hypothetical protein